MSNPLRAMLLVVGVILLLPGACSMVVTPLMVRSLFGWDMGIGGGPFEIFTFALYFVSLGFAIALGGLYLLQCATKRSLAEPAPRWHLLTAGWLLLLPGVSAVHILWVTAVNVAKGGGVGSISIQMMLAAPAFVAMGIYILRRTRNRQPEAGADELLLPAACSMVFAPEMLMSLFGWDQGIGGQFEMIAFALYFVSLGFAIALGGVHLLQCTQKGSLAEPAPRWLSISTGVLLLLPGVSAVFILWETAARVAVGWEMGSNGIIVMMLAAPAFVAIGIYILRRARNRQPEARADA